MTISQPNLRLVACWSLSILLPTLPVISACTSFPHVASAQEGEKHRGKSVVTFINIKKGQYSGIREPLQVDIRTQEEWNRFWKRHSSIEVPPSSPPHVDFAKEMVTGVFLGEKSTGGYSVEITKVERRNSGLYIYYREKGPPPDAMVSQALTQPYHLIKLPKYDATPVFLKER